jgi:hypothetical protein
MSHRRDTEPGHGGGCCTAAKYSNRSDRTSPDKIVTSCLTSYVLVEQGPALGRPLVDRLKGSTYHNMKELRPGSAGSTEVRMIFAFDPAREAVFLVAGDKSGRWQTWYQSAIPLADARFAEHLAVLKAEEQS